MGDWPHTRTRTRARNHAPRTRTRTQTLRWVCRTCAGVRGASAPHFKVRFGTSLVGLPPCGVRSAGAGCVVSECEWVSLGAGCGCAVSISVRVRVWGAPKLGCAYKPGTTYCVQKATQNDIPSITLKWNVKILVITGTVYLFCSFANRV